MVPSNLSEGFFFPVKLKLSFSETLAKNMPKEFEKSMDVIWSWELKAVYISTPFLKNIFA